jgi:hypothetical protein
MMTGAALHPRLPPLSFALTNRATVAWWADSQHCHSPAAPSRITTSSGQIADSDSRSSSTV